MTNLLRMLRPKTPTKDDGVVTLGMSVTHKTLTAQRLIPYYLAVGSSSTP